MRGLWGLTINSGRGATLKYLYDGWKENSRGDSDEYHRFLQFFILDLHKSEVGPLIYIFFFFRNEILVNNKIFLFQRTFLPLYTRVKNVRPLTLLFHRFTGFPFHEC